MIECPICHVMNEDQALFCSECGQRFAPPRAAQSPMMSGSSFPPVNPPQSVAPQQQMMQPQPQMMQPQPQQQMAPQQPQQSSMPQYQTPSLDSRSEPPKPSRPKFHSPLLDGDDPESYQTMNQSQTGSNFGGRGAQPQGRMEPMNRSDDEFSNKPKPKGGLRSPLLGGAQEDFDDEPAAKNVQASSGRIGQSKPPGLRSPLLGGADDGEDDFEQKNTRGTQSKSSGHLRSPLLGGADDASAKSNSPSNFGNARPAPKGGGHLRSPLLGGSDADDDDDDVPQAPAAKHGMFGGGKPQQKAGNQKPSKFDDDDDVDFKSQKSSSHFPHIRKHQNQNTGSEPVYPSNQGGFDAAGSQAQSQPSSQQSQAQNLNAQSASGRLRSPLLGGTDEQFDDVDETMNRRGGNSKQQPGRNDQRLNSPTLGNSSRAPRNEAQSWSDGASIADAPSWDEPASQKSSLSSPSAYTNYDGSNAFGIPKPGGAQSPQMTPGSNIPVVPQMSPDPLPSIQPAPQAALPAAPAPLPAPAADEYSNPNQTFRDRGFSEPAPSPASFRDRGYSSLGDANEPAVSPKKLDDSKDSRRSKLVPSIEDESEDFDDPKLKSSLRGGKPAGRSGFGQTGKAPHDDAYSNAPSAAPSGSSGPIMILVAGGLIAVIGKAYFITALVQSNQPLNMAVIADQLTQLILFLAVVAVGFTGVKR